MKKLIRREGQPHYRVVISLVHVIDSEKQPELCSCSLPGLKREKAATELYEALCRIGEEIQEVCARRKP